MDLISLPFTPTGSDALKTIYHSILSQHIALGSFSGQIQKCVDKIVVGAIKLHSMVSTTFLPTAIKFHYIFNLRDLSNIFQVSYIANLLRLKTGRQSSGYHQGSIQWGSRPPLPNSLEGSTSY